MSALTQKDIEEAPRNHSLKIWPQFFSEVASGRKLFELRRNDRDFQKGDRVTLREWEPESGIFTGWRIEAKISYILKEHDGIAPGFCIFGLDDIYIFIDRETFRERFGGLKE